MKKGDDEICLLVHPLWVLACPQTGHHSDGFITGLPKDYFRTTPSRCDTSSILILACINLALFFLVSIPYHLPPLEIDKATIASVALRESSLSSLL